MLDVSTDSRNYWKTLKNRLNKAQNQLVTRCNQLKMRAADGKMYLTDATDEDTMLLLIQHIDPNKVGTFRTLFKEITRELQLEDGTLPPLNDRLSTPDKENLPLLLDAYQKDGHIFIRMMLAGMDPEHISIVATCKNILIKGERRPKGSEGFHYSVQELAWGTFSRVFDFPDEVDINEIETTFMNGMLRIKVPILDKSRTKIIKI